PAREAAHRAMNEDPEAQLAACAAELADAAEAALAPWVEAAVRARVEQWTGAEPDDDVQAEAREAGRQATAAVLPALRELLATDVDEQRSTPLSVLRRAVAHPTAVLARAGVPHVQRDELAEAAFPDD